MKLLLDANISWRLSSKLKSHFENCLHVDRIGLKIPPSDKKIWEYALSNDLISQPSKSQF
jgi:predicted nuclease of predicted toxin-antitoxin system